MAWQKLDGIGLGLFVLVPLVVMFSACSIFDGVTGAPEDSGIAPMKIDLVFEEVPPERP